MSTDNREQSRPSRDRRSPDRHDGPPGGLSRWLIQRAARSAPAALSQRLEEEWLADLSARPLGASRLRFALGCCWATRVIAHEHSVSLVRMATTVAGAKTLAAIGPGPGFFSRRSTAVGLVVCLHLAVFYAFLFGLQVPFAKQKTPPLENRVLQPAHPPQLPTLPPPTLHPLKFDVPTPDMPPQTTADEPRDVIPAVDPPLSEPLSSSAESAPSQQSAHVATRMQGGPGAGFPNADDYYPSIARFKEEQGAAIVQVCVDPHGRLTSDPSTIESSGNTRLDDGALRLARAGSGHYRPTLEDGKPVSACYPFRVRFQLKN
jgi:TonB family protein